MRKTIRKAAFALPGIVVAALVSVGGVAAAASADTQAAPVQPMSCSHAHSNKDPGSGRATTTLRYRVGPHTSCAAPGQVGKNTLIYYHCYTHGQRVGGMDTWTWGRIAGTHTEGWFADAYLSDHGALAEC